MRLQGWADGAIARLPRTVREHFVLDPVETLRENLGLRVHASPHLAEGRAAGGACDGVSYLADGVVFYAPSRWNKRQNFTLAHELGHLLVDRDDRLLDWLGDQDRPEIVLENVCDVIAQRLLLPDDLVDSIVDAPVRARNILDLSDGSAASVPAAAIAVAARLPHMGAAIVIDTLSREVTAATVHPDPDHGWPMVHPWRGDAVPEEHSLLDVPPGGTFTRKSFWRSRWGRREDFYIDAVGTPGRVIAILSAADVWRTETLPVLDDRQWRTAPLAEVRCCGEVRQVRSWPCVRCRKPFCPSCGSCGCTGRSGTEGECAACHTLVAKHLLVDGLCEMCA